MRSQDYEIYTDPYKLNIVGVRNSQTQPNKFDDDIFVFFKNNLRFWKVYKYPATTDAGTFYLLNPINASLGTAMLKEGQYVNTYKRGLHRGSYLALVESKPVTTYRDYDRSATFDFGQKEVTGNFGINIHKAGENSIDVDKWSAGCQVFKTSDDFAEFMEMTKKHEDLYGNEFTYTLIDERAMKRRRRRIFLFSTMFIGYAALGVWGVKKLLK